MAVSAGLVSQNAKDFCRLCCKLRRKCSHVSFDRIVLELLDSEHGYLMDRASLEDIAHLYGIPLQRAQLIQNSAMKRIRSHTNQATAVLHTYAKHNSHLSIVVGKEPK